MLPVESASIVVRKVPLNVTKEQMEQIFLKAGAIKYVYFPKVPRHFTTKYCFIKFYDIRRAREAQQMFDGYRLGDQWLQVVSYDPTYKFRHYCSTQSLNSQFGASSGGQRYAASSSGMSQTSHTGARYHGTPASSSATPSRVSSPVAVHPRYIPPERVAPSNTPSFLTRPPQFPDNPTGSGSVGDLPDEDVDVDSDCGEYVDCQVVDNILLDSEVGFWSWLEQRLRAVGPLHYRAREIDDVLLKLPFPARKQFKWQLGAFRLCDKSRFQIIGPFICLLDQIADAKAKCLALCCSWRTSFTEFWEPIAPSEIQSPAQLIHYLRKLLIQFGPQTMDDMKLRQILRCLPRDTDNQLPSHSTFAEFLGTPSATKVVFLVGSIIFLKEEHKHIFQCPSDESVTGAEHKDMNIEATIPFTINILKQLRQIRKMENTNLIAAQKIDPKVTKIIASAPSVAIYGFVGKSWLKTEFEGALLVCGGGTKSGCCVIVLNQQKPQNFVTYMETGTTLQRKNEYLLYRTPNDEVKAIWFYNEADCSKIFVLLKEIVDPLGPASGQAIIGSASAGDVGTRPAANEPDAAALQNRRDIMAMLSNAQKNFNSQNTGKASGDAARHPPTSVKIDTLFKSHAAIRDEGGTAKASNQRVDSGGAFVSLAGRADSGDENRNKALPRVDEKDNQSAELAQIHGVQGAGIMLGKGRGRAPPMAPAIQQLLPTPGVPASSGQHTFPSAFMHVGPRPKATSSHSEMFAILQPDNQETCASATSALSPSVSQTAMSMRDDLITPADLGALNGGDAGDRIYQSMGIVNESLPIGPANLVNIAEPILSSGLNVEQFRQCFIYLLEHDQDFVSRLFELFAQKSTQRQSSSAYRST